MLNNGSISFTKKGNRKLIDASELARVFPADFLNYERSIVSNSNDKEQSEELIKDAEIKHLENLLDVTQKQLQDLKEDRDHWRQQASRLLGAPNEKGFGFLGRMFGKRTSYD